MLCGKGFPKKEQLLLFLNIHLTYITREGSTQQVLTEWVPDTWRHQVRKWMTGGVTCHPLETSRCINTSDQYKKGHQMVLKWQEVFLKKATTTWFLKILSDFKVTETWIHLLDNYVLITHSEVCQDDIRQTEQPPSMPLRSPRVVGRDTNHTAPAGLQSGRLCVKAGTGTRSRASQRCQQDQGTGTSSSNQPP